MIDISPVNNLQVAPHMNGNLFANFSDAGGSLNNTRSLPSPFRNGSLNYVGAGFAVTYNVANASSPGTEYTRLSLGCGSRLPKTQVEDHVWHYDSNNSSETILPDFPNPSKAVSLTTLQNTSLIMYVVYYPNASFGTEISLVALPDNTTALVYLSPDNHISVIQSNIPGNHTSSIPDLPVQLPFPHFDATTCTADADTDAVSLCVYYQDFLSGNDTATSLYEVSYDLSNRKWTDPSLISTTSGQPYRVRK